MTPSGASTSATSASSRSSARSASCSAATSPPAIRARWRSAPGRATSHSTCSRPGSSEQATCTDISPGMLRTLSANAQRLGLDVRTARADAESLPFADGSFDLVLGHAVLHHLPDLTKAFAEFHRVLAPGGRIVFAGEPSRFGDRIASWPKRGAVKLAPLWRSLLRARTRPAADRCRRRRRARSRARAARRHPRLPPRRPRALRPRRRLHRRLGPRRGARGQLVWLVQSHAGSLRGSQRRADVVAQYAFHGYLLLQRVDEHALEPRLPPAIFYNLLLSARRD